MSYLRRSYFFLFFLANYTISHLPLNNIITHPHTHKDIYVDTIEKDRVGAHRQPPKKINPPFTLASFTLSLYKYFVQGGQLDNKHTLNGIHTK